MKYLGIDPGTRNLALAILDENNNLLLSEVIDPQTIGIPTRTVSYVLSASEGIISFGLERFVSYKGVMSQISEDILMLIGGLVTSFEVRDIPVFQTRAIDWKPYICKYLFKNKRFKNPSTSFDKKFSIAAAECIIGHKPKTDHEADAICLAYYGRLRYEDQARQESSDQGKTKED